MKICVFGAGMMGAGIAQVFFTAGQDVMLCDIKVPFVEAGKSRI